MLSHFTLQPTPWDSCVLTRLKFLLLESMPHSSVFPTSYLADHLCALRFHTASSEKSSLSTFQVVSSRFPYYFCTSLYYGTNSITVFLVFISLCIFSVSSECRVCALFNFSSKGSSDSLAHCRSLMNTCEVSNHLSNLSEIFHSEQRSCYSNPNLVSPSQVLHRGKTNQTDKKTKQTNKKTQVATL